MLLERAMKGNAYKLFLANGVLAMMLALALPADALTEPIDIGSRLELFVDGRLIDRVNNVSLRMHEPERREVVFRFDAPWEGSQSGYVTVLKDGDRFRMYYRGGGDLSTEEVTCLAESTDGIHWTRPSLGLYEFDGSKENNIVWIGDRKSYAEAHNFTPFKDENPAASPEQRWKAVGLNRWLDPAINDHRMMLFALISPDGIHWKKLREEPIIREGSFDSQNIAFWDTERQEYVCYLRHGREGKRSIMRSTSPDFVNWSKPEWLGFGDTPLEHFYTNAIIPYFRAPHIYLGFPMRFVPERTTVGAEDTKVDALSDAVFMSSRDGLHWDRTFMEAFIRPGLSRHNWGGGHGNNTPAWGILPTGEKEISIYWSENYGTHEQAWGKLPQVRRGTLRVDGFVSVSAPYSGGELVTRPMVFEGNRLVLNYSTSAVGSVRVEIQDADGKPIEGYALDDCPEIYGDEIERVVSWKGGSDIGRLAGRSIRLRFAMKDADLYSIRTSNIER
jgi:hypothetical protein